MEQAEDLAKRHETYLATMEANDEKINAVVAFAQRLCDEGNFEADKIHKKAENITERYNYSKNICIFMYFIFNFKIVLNSIIGMYVFDFSIILITLSVESVKCL